MTVVHTLKSFLQRHHTPGRRLLAAISGGPDSLALFLALKRANVSFEVVHVDHSWRPESRAQADWLEELVEGVPFHRRTLAPPGGRNLEDCARQQRLAIYRELLAEGYQAVLLGHHVGDRAETVFKRIVEGASLPRLHGPRSVEVVDGVLIWRPLLTLPKSALEASLEGAAAIEDPSNRDERFHRARLRSLFPQIEEKLERPITGQLARLGAEAEELRHYLEERVAPYENFDGPLDHLHPFELRYLLRKHFPLSREALQLAVSSLLEKRENVRVSCGLKTLLLHRGRVEKF